MAKFVLLDHSLRGPGNHHFDYALNTLRAAERAGFDVTLVAHQSFHEVLPDGWPVKAVYKYDAYNEYTFFAGLDQLTPDGQWRFKPQLPWQWLVNRHEREARAIQFAHDTTEWFSPLGLATGDHVLLPALSEIDFVGLAQFLAGDARTRGIHWHLQFHQPILVGREPDYARQERRLERLRRVLIDGLQQTPEHTLHFYTPTDALAEQYNRLAVTMFGALPSPLGGLPPIAVSETPRPLCVKYHGDARLDKGYQHLPKIVGKLWNSCVETGDVRFELQSNFSFSLPARGRNVDVVAAHDQLQQLPRNLVALPAAPNDAEAYRRGLLDTDVGLLLYDPNHYATRASNTFIELLAAGVPMIVSAGTWLADQFADVLDAYHRELLTTMKCLQTIEGDKLSWKADHSEHHSPLKKTVLAVHAKRKGTPEPTDGACAIPEGATRLVVSFRWPEDLREHHHGASVLVEAEFLDAVGKPAGDWPTLVTEARPGEPATALVPLPEEVKWVRLSWCSPCAPQGISPDEMQFHFLAPAKGESHFTPLGMVGLVAARPEQAADLLLDVVHNYQHYRLTAREFARQWVRHHNPDNLVRELVAPYAAAPSRRRALAMAG